MSEQTAADTEVAAVNGADVAHNPEMPVLPLRAGETLQFTPPAFRGVDPKPTFEICVPSIATRAAYQRDLIGRAGEYPTDDYMFRCLKRGVADVYGDDADAVIARLDELREIIKEQEELAATKKNDPAVLQAAADEVRDVERPVALNDKRYGAITAARTYFREIMPLVAFQHFVRGWENVVDGSARPVAFQRKGLVSETAISRLPRLMFLQVSTQILELMTVSDALSKN